MVKLRSHCARAGQRRYGNSHNDQNKPKILRIQDTWQPREGMQWDAGHFGTNRGDLVKYGTAVH